MVPAPGGRWPETTLGFRVKERPFNQHLGSWRFECKEFGTGWDSTSLLSTWIPSAFRGFLVLGLFWV